MTSDKANLKALVNLVKNDVRSQTGGNIRKILMDTGIKISPGTTHQSVLYGSKIYEADEKEQWRIPVLQSLLKVRDDQWEIRFSDDCDDKPYFEEDDIEEMIFDICTS